MNEDTKLALTLAGLPSPTEARGIAALAAEGVDVDSLNPVEVERALGAALDAVAREIVASRSTVAQWYAAARQGGAVLDVETLDALTAHVEALRSPLRFPGIA